MYNWNTILILAVTFGWFCVAIQPQYVKLDSSKNQKISFVRNICRGGVGGILQEEENEEYMTIGIYGSNSFDISNDHISVIPTTTMTQQFLSIPSSHPTITASSSSIQSILVPSTTTTLDPTVLHTMGALCDVILCFIADEKNETIQELLKQIQMGMKRKSNQVKTQIVLFINRPHSEIIEQDLLLSNDNEDGNYQLTIHPISTSYTQNFWKQILLFSSSKPTITKDVPSSLFPTLVHQVLNSQLFTNSLKQQRQKYQCQVENIHLPAHFLLFDDDSTRLEINDAKEEEINQVVPAIENTDDLIQRRNDIDEKILVNDDHNIQNDTKKKIKKIVWAQVRSIFDRLQDKVEQYAFDYSSTNGKSMPILEFRSDAEKIIKKALQKAEDETDSILIQQTIAGSDDNNSVDTNIYTLFQQHVQNLREYYGCGYESILDEFLEKEIDEDENVDPKKRDAVWTEAASRATEGFRTAANHAIPNLIMSNLQSKYQSYVTIELEGLIRDLMQATHMRQPLNEQDDDDGEDIEEENYTKNRPTWYKKLFARALALGVNYLQGWLAYQGLKKAANERDDLIPKFPVF